MKIAIIGGGPAGFFAAIASKKHHSNYDVTIFEKTSKLLSKVKVSGGGRCNVTNACEKISLLSKSYPRGERFLKKAFNQFSTKDTVSWYEERGVKLKVESDNRIFPISNNSQSIIDCLLNEVDSLKIKIELKSTITSITKNSNGFQLTINPNKNLHFDKVIIASGGSLKPDSYSWLETLGHSIAPPIASLFTFNMPNESVKTLMGVVAPNATATIQGTKFQQSGPLLITHWGMSGPAILKLSSFGARYINEQQYVFLVRINWVSQLNEDLFRKELIEKIALSKKRKISNTSLFDLPSRLWEFILSKAEIDSNKTWEGLGNKHLNRLINTLLNDVYEVKGKTTFKEEFVTSGGVNLNEISTKTMESNICPGLYFAGEIMDIDGITGGFNFQAAWTTGFIAGKLN